VTADAKRISQGASNLGRAVTNINRSLQKVKTRSSLWDGALPTNRTGSLPWLDSCRSEVDRQPATPAVSASATATWVLSDAGMLSASSACLSELSFESSSMSFCSCEPKLSSSLPAVSYSSSNSIEPFSSCECAAEHKAESGRSTGGRRREGLGSCRPSRRKTSRSPSER